MKVGAIGDVQARGRGTATQGGDTSRPGVLLFARGFHTEPGLPGLVEAMLEREHQVVVAVDGERSLPQADRRALAELAERHPGLDQVRIPVRRDPWRVPGGAIRRSLDYLRCLEPGHESAGRLRENARERAPRLLRALLAVPPFRWGLGRQMLNWVLGRLETGLPIARAPRALIAERSPDAVVVPSGVELGSARSDFVRAAQSTGTPSVLVVGGVDPTDPARIRGVPALAIVAGQERVNEVVREHGLPRARVQSVDPQTIDGREVPSPYATVEALDEAAATNDVPHLSGGLLRPVLWALTPLMVLALPVLRPRATVRDLRRRRRLARKRAAAARKTHEQERAASRKAQGRAAKQERRARIQAKGSQKTERAAAKREKRARREAGKRQRRERGEHGRRAARRLAEASEETAEPGE